jgi:hypothetical protein
MTFYIRLVEDLFAQIEDYLESKELIFNEWQLVDKFYK